MHYMYKPVGQALPSILSFISLHPSPFRNSKYNPGKDIAPLSFLPPFPFH